LTPSFIPLILRETLTLTSTLALTLHLTLTLHRTVSITLTSALTFVVTLTPPLTPDIRHLLASLLWTQWTPSTPKVSCMRERERESE
jgi:hypothetical protein